MLLSILSIFLLLCCSAFFSASETAYSSVNRNRLKAMSEKGSICAKWALNLFSDYDQLLSTVLIGNNIVNIATTALGTVLFVKWYGPHWGTVFSTVFLTLLVLVFGEITPKGIAREFPEGFAVFAAPGLMLCKWVLYPLNIVFTYWKRLIARTLRLPDTPKMSQEELLMLVDEVQHDGSIDKDESALLKNAIKFTEGKAEDIITHRVDIAAVPVTATRDEVGNMFKETQYSRLLVYEENLDNIVGILLLKNFYASYHKHDWNLREILTPPFFVQKTEKIDDVLKKLQSSRSQIAVVLDEFGGTLGILSMEDILEELVGEIWDEHDEVVEKYKKVSPDVWLVDCTVGLDDFQEFFHVQLESEESMLSGWLLEQLQKLPQKGDKCQVAHLLITVSACSRHRVRTVAVRVLPEKEPSEPEASDALP